MSQLDQSVNADPNANYNKVERNITNSNDKHLPVKKVRFRKYKHKLNPWISAGIIRSIKTRDKLFRKYKSTPENDPGYPTLEINLETKNKILDKCIRNAKMSYYHNTCNRHQNNSKKTWDVINGILNSNKKKDNFPIFL